ncbi:MAG TPA: FG-GAP-like repeat-containing protein [Candidatus Brocadiia bacterium]|nr:FG-GAP-like repeat-containing protein [Candidatus Brocadiia bacterium]
MTRKTRSARKSIQSIEFLESRVLLDALFGTPRNYDVGAFPAAVCASDFNEDGRLDAAVASTTENNVSVLVGNGDGTFQTRHVYPAGGSQWAIISADFNEDGHADIATDCNDFAAVLLGNGDGTFQSPINLPAGAGGGGIRAADFNADDNLDIVRSDSAGDSISVFLGNGDGTFGPKNSIPVGRLPYDVSCADFNGDSKTDIVVPERDDVTVSILMGNGDGTFQDRLILAVDHSPWFALPDDLDADGDADLVVTNSGVETEPWDTISVFLNNGDGSFQPRQNYQVGSGPVSLASGDVDRDGTKDLVVTEGVGNTFSVLLGNGDGTFQPRIVTAASAGTDSAVIADLNLDGWMDVVVANHYANTMGVFINVHPSLFIRIQSPGDGARWPGDGSLTVSAALRTPAGRAVTVQFFADANNNGAADAGEPSVIDTDGSDGWLAVLDCAELIDRTVPILAVVETDQGEVEQDRIVVGVPALEPGVTRHEILGQGDELYYLFNIPASHAGKPITVTVDGTGDGSIELYMSRISSPTSSSFDYRGAGDASVDQRVVVPEATPGQWIVMLFGESLSADVNVSITGALVEELSLLDASPGTSGNAGPLYMSLYGLGFDDSTIVELVSGSAEIIPAVNTVLYSSDNILAAFQEGITPGSYSVRVREDGQTAELPDAITITQGGETALKTDLILPSAVGYHQIATIYLEYLNTGDIAMPAPLLSVSAQQNGRYAPILTLDSSLLSVGFWTSGMPAGFSNSVQLLAGGNEPGILQPGEARRVPIYYAGWQQPWEMSYPPIYFTLGKYDATNSDPIDWETWKAETPMPGIDAAAADVIWSNIRAQIGDTYGDYVTMLDENAAYLWGLGERVTDVSKLFGFELAQAVGFMQELPDASEETDFEVDLPGLPLSFTRIFGGTVDARFDAGTLGRGWTHSWEMSLEKSLDGTLVFHAPAGTSRTFQPDARGGYISVLGDHAEVQRVGESYQMQEPDGLIYSFLADGKVEYVQDLNGNRITAGYDGNLLTSLTHSAGRNVKIYYNGEGLIDRVTCPYGLDTSYTYDSGGHLVSVTDVRGQTTRYSYSSGEGAAREHAMTQVEFADGRHRYFTYYDSGLLRETFRDGEAEKLTYSYSSTGIVRITDATGHFSRYEIDYRGLPVIVEPYQGLTNINQYDSAGHAVRQTQPDGTAVLRSFDNLGNNTEIVDPLGEPIGIQWGDYRSVLSEAISSGAGLRYEYDARGNLVKIIHPDAGSELFTYDEHGNRLTWTNKRGTTVAYSYNSDGRLTSKDLDSDGDIDVSLAYDDFGRLISAANAGVTVTYTYDHGNLARISYPDDRYLEFTYDAVGRRLSCADQTGYRLDYGYDAAGRLETITESGGSVLAAYQYDEAGRLIGIEYENGVSSNIQRDERGIVSAITNYAPDDTSLSNFSYSYDINGRVASMTTENGTWSYNYDAVGRLVYALFDSADGILPDQELSYAYDALGNRVRTIINGVSSDYASNNLDQYTQAGDTLLEYDADGNLVRQTSTSGTTIFTYDAENRLVASSGPEGDWSYEYDALGNRIAVTHGGDTTRFVVDPAGWGDTVAEYASDGRLVARYNYGLGLISQVDDADNAFFYTFDQLGNCSEMTDSVGTIVSEYAYDPFGQMLLNNETVANRFQFQGQWGLSAEANGLTFVRARYYEPRFGIFTSPDPVHVPGDAYSFTANDPVNQLDPSGRFICRVVGMRPGTNGNLCDPPPDPDDPPPPPPQPPPPPPPPNPANPVPPTPPGDPNFKIGPMGNGEAGYVTAGSLFAYRIGFENEAEALAPAQFVAIRDIIDADLDPDTLELTEVGFGDRFVSIPEGSRHFETTILMNYNGQDIRVEIEIGYWPDTREVYANFISIDPATDLPPSVEFGFLPQEDGTGRGQGFMGYVIRPKDELPTGTEIRNVAAITFDFGDTITTNQVDPHDPSLGTDPAKECLNTIDADAPIGIVSVLPETTTTASFEVSWTGSDVGSGVRSYDVFVAVDRGPFELWLDDTNDASATYAGADGHYYSFYCVSVDNVGLVESKTPTAEAWTTVDVPGESPDGVIDSPMDGLVILVGSAINLQSSWTDPDGEVVAWNWTISGPENHSFTGEAPGVLALNTAGVYTITLTVTDDEGLADPDPAVATVIVQLGEPPDGMIDTPADGANVQVGSAVSFNGTGADPDAQLPLSFYWQIVNADTGATVATFSVEDPGVWVVPSENHYQATLTVTDAAGNVDPTPSVVDFYGVAGQPPDGTIDSPGDGLVINPGDTIDLRGSGADPDGAVEGWAWTVTGPGGFSQMFSVEDPGALALPDPGVYTVTLTVTDNSGITDPTPATATVTVNAAPTADDQSITVGEDNRVTITLTGADADGDALLYSVVGGPAHGTIEVTGVENGSEVLYTPNTNFAGADSFTFQTNDFRVDSDIATVSITINPINDAPVAQDGAATTREGIAVDIPLSATDVDNTPGDLTYAIGTGPTNGTVSIVGNMVTYTPSPGYVGTDTFTFTVADLEPLSDVGTVSVTVERSYVLLGKVATSAGSVYIYDVDGPDAGIAINGDYDETDGTKYNPYDPGNDLLIIGTPNGVIVLANARVKNGTTWQPADFSSLGLVVDGKLGVFVDQRLGTGDISFLAAKSGIGTAIAKSHITGLPDGALEVPGVMTIPEGAGLYSPGQSIGTVIVYGAGDSMPGDVIARDLGTFITGGGFSGDIVLSGKAGLIYTGYKGAGTLDGNVSAGSIATFYANGPVSGNVTTTGATDLFYVKGNVTGDLDVGGTLKTFYVAGNSAGSVMANDIGLFYTAGNTSGHVESNANIGTFFTTGSLTGAGSVIAGGGIKTMLVGNGVDTTIQAAQLGTLIVQKGNLDGEVNIGGGSSTIIVSTGDLLAQITTGGTLSSMNIANGTYRGTIDAKRIGTLLAKSTGLNGATRARILADDGLANLFVLNDMLGTDVGVGVRSLPSGKSVELGFLYVGGKITTSNVLVGVWNENDGSQSAANPFSDGTENGTPYVPAGFAGTAKLVNVHVGGTIGTAGAGADQWAIGSKDKGLWREDRLKVEDDYLVVNGT